MKPVTQRGDFFIYMRPILNYRQCLGLDKVDRYYWAETFNFAQTNGSSGSPTTTDLGSSGNLFNFKNSDDATASNYASNPITASDVANNGDSYEIWLRMHFTGTFSVI